MRVINDSEEFRSNVVAKLKIILEDEIICSNLEKGIFNYSLEHADKLNVVKKWDNSYFVKIYLDRLRSIYTNLQDDGIKQSMKNKTIKAHTLAFMTHPEMRPDRWNDLIQEKKITIWNQLTMTTGLDDNVSFDCTNDTCLLYLSDPGTRWAYHNAPYTLLRPVIENATGQGINLYNYQKLLNPIGMNGIFLYSGYNNIFNSTSRSMARFGLLILNNGKWDGNQIMSDANYFNQMLNTSQMLNESYGYLWWLNGKSSSMLPGSQFVFNGDITPNAPDDLVSALGKNGQIINVVPSENLVWIRMGEAPDSSLVPHNFNIAIWNYINDLPCSTSSIDDYTGKDTRKLIEIIDVLGRKSRKLKNQPLFYIYDDGSVEKRVILE